MTKLKLTASIFIMLMITSTMVFSQTGKPVKNQDKSAKTASVSTTANFVDKNNDGICDNCGKTKAECNNCKTKCTTASPNCSHGKANCSPNQTKCDHDKTSATGAGCDHSKGKHNCCAGKGTGTK
jgi:hypothetical protein